jgi:glycosyltransferase involved in cell wall biosynthesis
MNIALLQFYSHAPAPDLHEMARWLRSWGHRVVVATPDRTGNLVWDDGKGSMASQKRPPRSVSPLGRVPVIRSLLERGSRIRFLWGVRKFLLAEKFDVVQVNPSRYEALLVLGLPASTLAVLDVRQAGEVSDGSLRGNFRNWRVRTGLRLDVALAFDHACFATEAAAERILGERWRDRATVHRVGQDPSFLTHRWDESKPARSGDTVRFIYTGTLSRVRRLERVIEAIGRLRKLTEDFSVDFAGPDASDGFYERMVREGGLERWVRFIPAVPYAEVASLVSAYDVGLVYVPDVQDWQYQPTLKILEFRAIGMPVVATDNAPNREIVDHEVNGLLIGETVDDLVRAMERFVTDRSFLESCRREARRMRRGRTWEESARGYLAGVYEKRGEISARGVRRLLRLMSVHTR